MEFKELNNVLHKNLTEFLMSIRCYRVPQNYWVQILNINVNVP